ncbi:MAG: acetyl-CoA decarbonylase/synthase complex subunit delta [Deltaproteobacteria bacterium]|nr:acetyl-CoA decarbonylase/synthase complex subunit delta [Deltaproteobacteria bacterium]
MEVKIPTRAYSGAIRPITLGKGGKAFTVGGETAFPFYTFEGQMPNQPRFGLEVLDLEPSDWPATLLGAYGAVVKDPAAWAKKCVAELGADFVHLTLAGTNPNDQNLPVDHAVKVAKAVAAAVDVPLTVWGCGSAAKDAEVLKAVAEALSDRRLCIGPVVEENYRQVGAAALAYNHVVIASTPIDINLAKQLNVLLGNLGVKEDSILIDPTVGGLGYGLEYTYSVMERCRAAALTQQDDKLQYPMYCHLGVEVWKTKEAKLPGDADSALGDESKRGVLMEAVTAATLLAAGADVLVMRHPEAMRLSRELVKGLATG